MGSVDTIIKHHKLTTKTHFGVKKVKWEKVWFFHYEHKAGDSNLYTQELILETMWDFDNWINYVIVISFLLWQVYL